LIAHVFKCVNAESSYCNWN